MEALTVINIVSTLAIVAVDLYQGHYKAAAIDAALGLIPFGKIFKFFRPARALASSAMTPIVNLAPDAVTEVAHLAPEVATQTDLVLQEIAEASALLPPLATELRVAGRAVGLRASGVSEEAAQLLLARDAEIVKEYNGLKRAYELQMKAGGSSAADLSARLRPIVGTQGWQAKLCALRVAHYAFTGQDGGTFATLVDGAVTFALRGSGLRCDY